MEEREKDKSKVMLHSWRRRKESLRINSSFDVKGGLLDCLTVRVDTQQLHCYFSFRGVDNPPIGTFQFGLTVGF